LSGQKQVFTNKSPLLRTAVIVMGMHRSGTSAFARVVSLLGCDLPNNLMPSDEGNDLGHWESNSITALNERLLASAGSKWDDWTPLNEGWEESAVIPSFLVEAQEVLRDDYGKSPLFVLKDPRICRLTSFWLKAIEGLDIRPVIAFPLRNPNEVSNSLATRDGSDQGFGLLLWLRHVLEAEATTRHLPRYFFTFEQLLANWSQVIDGFEAATDMRFPRRSVAVETEIATFLTEDARHERETSANALAAAPPWVRDAYAILKRWCDNKVEADDFALLDAIRAEFDAASPSFARLIAKGVQTHGGFGAGAQARAALEQTRQEVERLQAGAAQAAQVQAALEDARGEMKRLHDETAQAAQDREALNDARGEIERLRRDKAEAEQIRLELSQARSEVEHLQGEAAAAAQARAQFAQEFNDMNDANRRMEAEIAKLNSAVRQRQEEATQAWAKAETEQRLREKAEAEQARLIRQNEELIAQFAAIDERVRADASALASARRRASDAESAMGQISSQHERLLTDLESQGAELRQAQSRAARADNELAQLAILQMNAHEQVRELKETASRTDMYRARARELEEVASRVNAYQAEIVVLSQRADAAEEAGHQAQVLLSRWQSETRAAQEALAKEQQQAKWLQDATAVLQKKPRLRALLSLSARRQYSRDQLKASGLFDAESYLEKNPDVAAAGEDPLLHFIRHGLREGRPW
jgi:predicted  nucleic acid-binding Zn-ribbon protein